MSIGTTLRKYGVQTTVDFQLFEIDGVDFRVDAAHAVGDSIIMKDEGAEANTTNAFADEGRGYSIVLTATEMEAARIVVYFVDQTAPKAWLDMALTIETYGNASAQHAVDLDDGVRAGLTALPNAAADAAGGLPVSDAGGLDLDTQLANTDEVTAARMGALTDWLNGGRLDLILDIIAADVVNLDGDAMRGTDNALLAASINLAAGVVEANLLQMGGVVQSATDLKDFADDGYDPVIDKVQGVVLVDTTTTNTDMRGTDAALLAASVNVAAGIVEANLIQMRGVAQSAIDLTDFADAGYDPVANKVEGVKLVDTTTTNTDMRGTDNAALAATALSTAIWTAARAGYLDELAAANLPTDIADLPTVAEFNARTLVAASYFDPATDTVVNVTNVANLSAGAIIAASYAAGAITAAAIAANAITSSEIATDAIGAAQLATTAVDEIVDQVWDELIAGHLGAGSTGAALNGASAPTVGQIADAVWDELIAGHLGAGSTGASLNAAGIAGDPWIAPLPGAYPVGQAGNIIGNLEADTCSCVTAWYNKYISVLTNFRTGDAITIRRGDTLTLNIKRLGDISTRTDIWFTVKEDQDDADTASWIQISETVGLEYINGTAAAIPANGSITVTDAVAGDIAITLAAVESAKLQTCAKAYYDIQVLYADGTISTLVANRVAIVRDTTRVTS